MPLLPPPTPSFLLNLLGRNRPPPSLEKPILSLNTLATYESPTASSIAKQAKTSKTSATRPSDASPSITRSRTDSASSTTSQASGIATPKTPKDYEAEEDKYTDCSDKPKRNHSKDPTILAADYAHLWWLAEYTEENPIILSVCKSPSYPTSASSKKAIERTMTDLTKDSTLHHSHYQRVYNIGYDELYKHINNNRVKIQKHSYATIDLIKECCKRLLSRKKHHVWFAFSDTENGCFVYTQDKIRHLPES